MKRFHFIAQGILVLLMVSACSLFGLGEGAKNGRGGTARLTYEGLQLERLESYTADFTMTFTPDSAAESAWTYQVDLQTADAPSTHSRQLHIEGVENPGDVTLLRTNSQQYMFGEAVGEASCLIFEVERNIDRSFLLPDDLLSPEAITGNLEASDEVTVAGQSGTAYTLEVETLDDFENVEGELVLAEDSNAVLSYEFRAQTTDPVFESGANGTLEWNFQVKQIGDVAALTVPDSCTISYPLPDDASELARLPGIITFKTALTPEEVITFYHDQLTAEGWLRTEFPATQNDTTVVSYALNGEILDLSVRNGGDTSSVQIFLEEEE